MLTAATLITGIVAAVIQWSGVKIDHPAWQSGVDEIQVQVWQQDFALTQLRLSQLQSFLLANQTQQEQFKLKRVPVPAFFLEQQAQLEAEIAQMKARLDLDQKQLGTKQQ